MSSLSIVFDFDGTLATNFVGGMMFRGYVPEAEPAVARVRFDSKVTSLREYQEEVFDLVTESPVEMSKKASDGASVRPLTKEVCERVWNAGGSIAVASTGLDFYIRPVLDKTGLSEINVHCGKVIYEPTQLPPFRYDYPSADEMCNGDGVTCKSKVINKLKDQSAGGEVVFAGDGIGLDACAAVNAADKVFANGRLLILDRYLTMS
ncbi:MAG: haloacid dehalogenase-like hydrolase [Chloroflexi bacterium]|nr:haloacid dehalogenase-like hydrolase [Chloroflexota bacterium]